LSIEDEVKVLEKRKDALEKRLETMNNMLGALR
jgi:prefoldin subunit 5